jgi:site-specific recombinase XerD
LITLAQALDEFEGYIADARRFSERTVRAYRSDLDRFAGFWERDFGEGSASKTPLNRVDTLAVRSYLASLHRARLAAGRSPGTCRRYGPSFGGPAAKVTWTRIRRGRFPRPACRAPFRGR